MSLDSTRSCQRVGVEAKVTPALAEFLASFKDLRDSA